MYCACHAKCKNDLPAWEFEAPKKASRARLPPVLTLWSWKSTISQRFFLKLFPHSSKNMILPKPPAGFKTLTKCCPCHDFQHCVMFVQPRHSDSPKEHLRISSPRHTMLRLPRICISAAAQSAAPVTRKRRASIQTLLKYFACHAKRTRYLHACHETQQDHVIGEEIDLQQMILSKFASATQRWGLATSSWAVANAKTTRANTTPTFRPPELNENPSLRIRVKWCKMQLFWVWQMGSCPVVKATDEACKWLQANPTVWKTWLPDATKCFPQFGLYNPALEPWAKTGDSWTERKSGFQNTTFVNKYRALRLYLRRCMKIHDIYGTGCGTITRSGGFQYRTTQGCKKWWCSQPFLFFFVCVGGGVDVETRRIMVWNVDKCGLWEQKHSKTLRFGFGWTSPIHYKMTQEFGKKKGNHSPKNFNHPVQFVIIWTKINDMSLANLIYQTLPNISSNQGKFISSKFFFSDGTMGRNHPKIAWVSVR